MGSCLSSSNTYVQITIPFPANVEEFNLLSDLNVSRCLRCLKLLSLKPDTAKVFENVDVERYVLSNDKPEVTMRPALNVLNELLATYKPVSSRILINILIKKSLAVDCNQGNIRDTY